MRYRYVITPSTVSAAGLVGGFAVARYTGRRNAGGAVFAVAGAWCAREWARRSGGVAAAGMSALYLTAMGGSHPLAKKLGAWPSVLTVAAVTAAASELSGRSSPPPRHRATASAGIARMLPG
jgi:hypothetical protein